MTEHVCSPTTRPWTPTGGGRRPSIRSTRGASPTATVTGSATFPASRLGRLPRRPRRGRDLAQPVLSLGAGRRRLRRGRLPRRRPELGTLDDFDDLVSAAHRAGLKVIVDIVPNHTSNRHLWFTEALASAPGSAARARYIFRDGTGPDGSEPPSDWPSHFGGSAWTASPSRTAGPGSGTATCSRPNSPTSTGTTRRCARTS